MCVYSSVIINHKLGYQGSNYVFFYIFFIYILLHFLFIIYLSDCYKHKKKLSLFFTTHPCTCCVDVKLFKVTFPRLNIKMFFLMLLVQHFQFNFYWLLDMCIAFNDHLFLITIFLYQIKYHLR